MTLERVEFDGTRYYRVGDLLLPSVTTVLDVISKPWLHQWREDVGDEEADNRANESAIIGTIIHDAFERISHYEPVEQILADIVPDDSQRNMIYSYERWFKRNVERVLATEDSIYSLRGGGFAGTADGLFLLYGHRAPTLIDFKTTNSAHIKDWQLQIAAYRAIYFDRGIDTDMGMILHIDKSYGRITSIPILNYQESIDTFMCTLKLWRYVNE